MQTTLDCIPCFIRQSLVAARNVSDDPTMHERLLRQVLSLTADMNLNQCPPRVAQYIHRSLREMAGTDPYAAAKERFNAQTLDMLPSLREYVQSQTDPLLAAVRLAVAGNTIDLGANHGLTLEEARHALESAWDHPLMGNFDTFREATSQAQNILYLADNAGEIVLDRILIELLGPERVTVVVRGGPIINDATLHDAESTGLCGWVEVLENGSDAPGTILEDCSPAFRERFMNADMVIAKGQGNFESLDSAPRPVFFLFKVKCPVAAALAQMPLNAHVVLQSTDI